MKFNNVKKYKVSNFCNAAVAVGMLSVGIILGSQVSAASAEWCDPAVSDLMLASCECKNPNPTETGWKVAKDECVFAKAGTCAGTVQYKDISGPIPTPRDTVACHMVNGACVPKPSAFTGANIVISINNCHVATADECTGTCLWEKLDPPVRFTEESGCQLKAGGGGGDVCSQ